jgi:lysine 6-dehydrogenase
MRVAVLGLGLMGPTIALDCLSCEDVEEVLLIDISKERLDEVVKSLNNNSKLKTLVQDVTERGGLVNNLKGYDVAFMALLYPLNVEATRGAMEAGVHVVDLSGPTNEEWEEINSAALKGGVTVVPGCGVEPGLTEMLAAHGMDMLDRVDSVDFWCGGIPRDPKPPLNYKIVFGGPYLPLRPGKVKVIEDGEERWVKRYTLGEPIEFEGVERELECFYDGFPDTLYEIDKFKDVRHCAEKTVRYAGYCDKVNLLDELGLLSRETIDFRGQKIVPFQVFSEIVFPKVRLEEGERDITLLRVVVEGARDEVGARITFDMVDHYDEDRGITSMAKTTSYTSAIVGRMLGRGEISERGLVPPCVVIRGEKIERLLEELTSRGVHVKRVEETIPRQDP